MCTYVSQGCKVSLSQSKSYLSLLSGYDPVQTYSTYELSTLQSSSETEFRRFLHVTKLTEGAEVSQNAWPHQRSQGYGFSQVSDAWLPPTEALRCWMLDSSFDETLQWASSVSHFRSTINCCYQCQISKPITNVEHVISYPSHCRF